MDALITARRESMRLLFPPSDSDLERPQPSASQRKLALEQNSSFVQKISRLLSETQESYLNERRTPMEIRLKNVTYQRPKLRESERKIATIYNSSPVYKVIRAVKDCAEKKGEEEEYVSILTDVNLVLKPKKMYLVLGPPLSGKTSLLKAIAGMITKEDGLTGCVEYNNVDVSEDKKKNDMFRNLVAFVQQSDDHAGRLTVDETFTFAAQCKDKGFKRGRETGEGFNRVESTLEALGLTYVKDTFVGDESVRGVSGGQKRRVTLGEVRRCILSCTVSAGSCLCVSLSCI